MSEFSRLSTEKIIKRLRESFYPRNEHHPMCSSKVIPKGCDCYAKKDQESHKLLDEIARRIS